MGRKTKIALQSRFGKVLEFIWGRVWGLSDRVLIPGYDLWVICCALGCLLLVLGASMHKLFSGMGTKLVQDAYWIKVASTLEGFGHGLGRIWIDLDFVRTQSAKTFDIIFKLAILQKHRKNSRFFSVL